MKVRFVSPANIEFDETVRYYDHLLPGLGFRFLQEVDAAIERIRLTPEVWTKRLMVLHAAPSLEALMLNPGNKFHSLEGDRKGQYAISINKQWRVCFEWHNGNAFNTQIIDYH